jgi:hypothetical protein
MTKRWTRSAAQQIGTSDGLAGFCAAGPCQLRNFAAGNVGLENERVTRAVVDEAARRLGRGA